MNIDDIKNFLENEPLIKKLKLDCYKPTRLKYNEPILKQILSKHVWLKNANELIYLIKRKNELENLHIFCCVCGKKNKFNRTSVGYFLHCSRKCQNSDKVFINKIKNKRRNDVDENGFDSYKRANLKMQKYYQIKERVNSYLQTEEFKNKKRNMKEQIQKSSGDTCEKKFGNRVYARSAHRFYLDPNHKHFDDINEEFFRNNFIINGKFDVEKCASYFGTKIGWINKFKKKFNIIESNITLLKDKNIKSKPQKQVYDFIKSIYNNKILYNTKSIISPQELDIYLPDVNLAIEFNGTYWHSTKANKYKYYHQNKFKVCLAKGIRLIQIYEDEWNDSRKQEIIKNIIRRAIGLDNKVITNLTINEISINQYRDFCTKYNLKDYKEVDIMLGLFDNNKLVQIIGINLKESCYTIKVNCHNFDLYRDYTKELLEYFNMNFNKRKLHIIADIICDKDEIQIYFNCNMKILKLYDPMIRYYKNLTLFDSGIFTLIS